MPNDTPTRSPLTCPACQTAIALLALVPWGDGEQKLPVAPWICASCAALGLIELATGQITLPPEALWQVVQDRNPVLWQTLVAARARIRGDADHAERCRLPAPGLASGRGV